MRHRSESLNRRCPMRAIVAPAVWDVTATGRALLPGNEYDRLECGHRRERKPSEQYLMKRRRCTECAGINLDEPAPIPMVLNCPSCGWRHVDAPEPQCGFRLRLGGRGSSRCMKAKGHTGSHAAGSNHGDFRWTNPPHKSHLCHGCGCVWRPADVPTVGVERIKTRGNTDTWPTL